MCTSSGERRSISIPCQKECLESKLDGWTDSHSDDSAHLRVVQYFDTKSLKNSVVIDNFDLIFPI